MPGRIGRSSGVVSASDALRPATKRAYVGGVSCLFSMFILLLSVSLGHTTELRRVLLPDSFGPDCSQWGETAARFRAELFRLLLDPLDLYEASVFTERFEKSREEAPLIDYVGALFFGHKLDLVVAIGGPAVSFAQRNRSQLFPATPMLTTGVAEKRADTAALTSNDTVVGLNLDLKEYIRNILRILPETTNTAVVIGNTAIGKYWLADLSREHQAFTDRVKFTWFDDLSFGEILAKVANLPRRSLIFYFLFDVDAEGVPHVQGQALSALHEVVSAPIFGSGDYELASGIVGDPLNATGAIDRPATGVAARLLKGEAPADIKTPTTGFAAPTYDSRELKRWNISENLLPPDSVLRLQQPSVWQQYRWQTLLVASVLFAQSLLIVYGLVQNRRRQRAERSLAESEQRMTFTAASVNVGLWHFTRATEQFWITEYCRTIFKLEPNVPFTREKLMFFVHPDDKRVALEMLTDPSNGGAAAVREFRIVLSDGQTRWLRARTNSSSECQGVPDKVSGIFMDLTELKAAETAAAVQRSELAHLMRVSVLGELSGAIAHELNQPLTAILSNAQAALRLLARQCPDLEEVRGALSDIVHEDNRAAEVIKRIRRFLKKGESKIENVDINDLVNATILLLHSELITRRVNVDLELTPDVPGILGDPIQLQQVILNIVMNAMDAMTSTPAGWRRMAICTEIKKNGFVEVSIRDRGTGIRPADERRLFEPFYTTKDQGLGLGLALCSSIIEAHGGKLTLANHADGGAVAVFSLPVEQCLVAAQ